MKVCRAVSSERKRKGRVTNHFSFFFHLRGRFRNSLIELIHSIKCYLLFQYFQWVSKLLSLSFEPACSLCLLHTRWISSQHTSENLWPDLSPKVQILHPPVSGSGLSCQAYRLLTSQRLADSLCCADFLVSNGGLRRRQTRTLSSEYCHSNGGYRQQTLSPQGRW